MGPYGYWLVDSTRVQAKRTADVAVLKLVESLVDKYWQKTGQIGTHRAFQTLKYSPSRHLPALRSLPIFLMCLYRS
jgi:hypothetical protein